MKKETEGKETRAKGKITLKEENILAILVVGTLLVVLFASAGPALWKGITSLFSGMFPSAKVVGAYIWIAIFAFCIGRISKKK